MRGLTLAVAAGLGIGQAVLGLSTMAKDRARTEAAAAHAGPAPWERPEGRIWYGGTLPALTVSARGVPALADWHEVLPAAGPARTL